MDIQLIKIVQSDRGIDERQNSFAEKICLPSCADQSFVTRGVRAMLITAYPGGDKTLVENILPLLSRGGDDPLRTLCFFTR